MNALRKSVFFLVILAPTASCLKLNTVEFITSNGYPCETHKILTKDGYILTYQRIPHGVNNNKSTGPPVLLAHGLGSSSADFVNLGTNISLAYLLADNGFDVWLGNNRGVSWSRQHISLDPIKDAEQFFDFSFDEMGTYDMPDSIDYILSRTNRENLQVICHSQGCSQGFVMLVEHPAYNKKIKLISMLAPAIYMHQHYVTLNAFLKYTDTVVHELKLLDVYELPLVEYFQNIAVNSCRNKFNHFWCRQYLRLLALGHDSNYILNEFIPIIGMNTPEHLSIRQLLHFGQLVNKDAFTAYDFGIELNLQRYKLERPTKYNLTKATLPIALYYGENDIHIGLDKIPTLTSQLSNIVKLKIIPEFNHLDFLWAYNARKQLYNEVVKLLIRYK